MGRKTVGKTLLRSFILLAIESEATGTTIKLPEFYQHMRRLVTMGPPSDAPSKILALFTELQMCADSGDLPDEPRWKNEIRWALRHARDAGMIKQIRTAGSGDWMRT